MSYGALARINTNVQSLRAQFALNNINEQLSENQLKLATGLRINNAEDDAAGFSIASKLSAKLAGLQQAGRNVGNAKSMLTVAESGMNSIMDTLVQMKTKTTQAATGSIGAEERGYISDQLEAMAEQINTIAEETNFGGVNLLGAVSVDEANSTAATVTAANAVTTGDTFDGGSFDLNGTTVNLTSVAALDGSTTAVTMDEAVDALQADIDAAFGGSSNFTVGKDGSGSLTITANDYETNVNITAVDDGASGTSLTGLGIDGTATPTAASVTYTNAIGSLEFQVGEGADDQMTVNLQDVTIETLFSGLDGATSDISVDTTTSGNGVLSIDTANATAADFQSFLENIDSAIQTVASAFNQIGIDQNALSTRRDNITNSVTANSAARSRIEDANFAKVQSETVKLQIMQQTAIAALSQANMSSQAVLGFLR